MRVWELRGPRDGWQGQLVKQYAQQPVFAVLNSVSGGSWKPIHEICVTSRIPCLLPTTDLPVVDPGSFYTIYLSKGITIDAEAVAAQNVGNELSADSVVQIYDPANEKSRAAAAAFRQSIGGPVREIEIGHLGADLERGRRGPVLWLDDTAIAAVAQDWPSQAPESLWSSGTMLPVPVSLDERLREIARIAYSTALPEERDGRLLARSTGWLRIRRILSSEWPAEQANAYFTLKAAGSSFVRIGGHFKRDYFLENFEHMIDNASYTSVCPRISLAPDQRFVSK